MSWTSLSIASSYRTAPALVTRNWVPTSRLSPCGVENSSAGVAGSTTLVSVTATTSPSVSPLTVWVVPIPSPDEFGAAGRDGTAGDGDCGLPGTAGDELGAGDGDCGA